MAFVPIPQRNTRERDDFAISVRPADTDKRQRAARGCAYIPVSLQEALEWADGEKIEVLEGTGTDAGKLMLRRAPKGVRANTLATGAKSIRSARNVTFTVPETMRSERCAPVTCAVNITKGKELVVTLAPDLLRLETMATAEATPVRAVELPIPPDQLAPVAKLKPEVEAARQKAVEAPKPPPGPDTLLPAPKATTPPPAAPP